MKTGLAILIFLATAGSAQDTSSIKILGDTELTGETYYRVKAGGKQLSACMALCEADESCAAFTLSLQPETSYCELKRTVGRTVANRGRFISGIKEQDGPGGQSRGGVIRIPAGQTHSASTIREVIVDPEELAKLERHFKQMGVEMTAPIPREESRSQESPRQAISAGRQAPVRERASEAERPAAPPADRFQFPTEPSKAQRPTQLSGTWSVNEDSRATVDIAQEGDTLTFTDSGGRKGHARVVNGKVVSDGWKMDGVILDSGRTLRWSNGSVWRRIRD